MTTQGKPGARAVSYLRVSTQRQADTDYDPEGFSIPAQRQLVERKAQDLGAEIVAEFVEAGGSGRTIQRKALQRMLAFLAEDGHVDYVIVAYIDRFARQLTDHVLLKVAIEKAGARLVSATENIDDSDAGQLIAGVLAVVAQYQSDHNVGKVKDGMRRKAEAGGTPGRAPVGYRNTVDHYDGRPIRTISVDPDRAPHVRWAFEQYASGDWTLARLTDALNSRGLRSVPAGRHRERPLAVSNVATMLQNPYYLGVVMYNGVRYPGRHEPLIDQALFEKVRDVLSAHGCGEKQRTHRRHLTSTLYCGYCGNRLCFSRNTGHGGTYEYWLCLGRQKRRAECSQRYIPDDEVEQAVVAYWQRVRLDDKGIVETQAHLDEYCGILRDHGGERIAELRVHIGKLRGQERELLTLRYDNAISRELFADEQRRIAVGVAAAEAEIARLEVGANDVRQVYAQAGDLLRHFPELYAGAPPALRRQCNQAIFTRLYLQGPRITGATLTPLAAGLLHNGAGWHNWGSIPGADAESPPEDGEDDPTHQLPDTILLVRGSRMESLVPPAGHAQHG